jgi:hypothetical protein
MEMTATVFGVGQAAPGAISLQERELLVDLLERSRDVFVASVSAVTDAAWQTRPAEDAWSAAECAEHIVISERVLREIATHVALATPARPELAPAVRGKDGAIVQAMRDRSHRAKTLPVLEPAGRWPGRAGLVARFLEERAATLAYIRTTGAPLHFHFAPLEPFGDLDGYQWVLLLASHTERHAAQIDAASARVTATL